MILILILLAASLLILAVLKHQVDEYKTRLKLELRERQSLAQQLDESLTELKRANEETAQARHEAEVASSEKMAFLATVTHELRTPLHGMLGIQQLLALSKLTPRQKKLLSLMESSSSQLLGLMEDVIDISRISSGKLVFHDAVFTLKDLQLWLYPIFKSASRDKHFDFFFRLEKGHVPLFADRERFAQIIMLLVNNAFQYTVEGEVRLLLKYQQHRVSITVEDTGQGVPDTKLKEIFKPFIQVSEKRHEKKQGLGLGLTIVKSITEQLNGSIHCESQRAKGSCFSVSIPVRLADNEDLHPLPQSSNLDEACEVEIFGDKTVVIAEDEAISRMFLVEMMQAKAWEVFDAENGYKAFELVKRERPALVLMDLSMPNMTGVEAIQSIRDWEKTNSFKPVPIILFTAHVSFEHDPEVKNCGSNAFVAKPFSEERLWVEIRRVMQNQ